MAIWEGLAQLHGTEIRGTCLPKAHSWELWHRLCCDPLLPPSAAPNQLISAMTGRRKGGKWRCYKFAVVGARMMLVSFGFASSAWFCSLELPKAGHFTAFRAFPAVSLVLPSKTELISPPPPPAPTGQVAQTAHSTGGAWQIRRMECIFDLVVHVRFTRFHFSPRKVSLVGRGAGVVWGPNTGPLSKSPLKICNSNTRSI